MLAQVDSFLQQLASVGLHDSRGAFTMDLEAAARKFSHAAGLQPALFLAKLVQAGVVSQAREVRIQIGAETVMIKIVPTAEESTWRRMPELMNGQQEHETRLSQHVLQSFALAKALNPRELSFEYRANGEFGYHLDLLTANGVPTSFGKDWNQHEPPYVIVRFRHGLPPGFWAGLVASLRPRANYHSFMAQRCCFSPVPVFVDGARINNPLSHDALVHRVYLKDSHKATSFFPVAAPKAVGAGTVWLAGQVYSGTTHDRCFLYEIRNVEHARVEARTFGPQERPGRYAQPLQGGTILVSRFEEVPSGEYVFPFVREQSEWLDCRSLLPRLTPSGSTTYLASNCWLSCAPGGGAYLLPIQDGFLMDKINLAQWPSGSRAVVVLSDKKTDINLTGIIQDEEVEGLIAELGRELEELKAKSSPAGNRA